MTVRAVQVPEDIPLCILPLQQERGCQLLPVHSLTVRAVQVPEDLSLCILLLQQEGGGVRVQEFGLPLPPQPPQV